jgi:hypothetical protein
VKNGRKRKITEVIDAKRMSIAVKNERKEKEVLVKRKSCKESGKTTTGTLSIIPFIWSGITFHFILWPLAGGEKTL